MVKLLVAHHNIYGNLFKFVQVVRQRLCLALQPNFILKKSQKLLQIKLLEKTLGIKRVHDNHANISSNNNSHSPGIG